MVRKQCCDKPSRTLHTRSSGGPASSSSFTVGAGGVGEGMEGREWAAKPGALDTLGNSTAPRHIRGGRQTSGHLGDALTPSGPKELHSTPFHLITLCISQGSRMVSLLG